MIGFDVLIERLQRRLGAGDLPGAAAHELMRAVPVGTLKPRFNNPTPPRPGSVLIMLYQQGNEILFPLIKRPDYEGAHSGQVSFPGGKAEPGETVYETALREGEEEIGVDAGSIQIIGRLSEFFVIPSNFKITPVVGFVTSTPVMKPDPIEVARILNGSLESILPDSAIRNAEILAAQQFRMMAPHFEVENEIVWGATAMMLNEFRLVVKEIL